VYFNQSYLINLLIQQSCVSDIGYHHGFVLEINRLLTNDEHQHHECQFCVNTEVWEATHGECPCESDVDEDINMSEE